MSLLFENTCNTRLLFKNDTRFIRSDVPIKLTEDEIQWLIHHNVRTIFDLRSENERFKQPSLFENDTRFIYHHTPVTGGNHIPRTPEEVSLSYIHMVDENMWKIIYMMLHASTHVLYFCNAGKDRTGIVSAILMLYFGMDHESIVEDYLISKDNLQKRLEMYVQNHPHIDMNVITPRCEYIERFLEDFEQQYDLQMIKKMENNF